MAVTNVTVGGLSIHDGTTYAVSADTLTMLEAANPESAVMVDMTRRHPEYIRSQPEARPITLGVYMLRPNAVDRKTDYDALVAATSNAAGLFTLTWTDGSVTKQYLVHRSSCVPETWFFRAALELTSPNPTPVTV